MVRLSTDAESRSADPVPCAAAQAQRSAAQAQCAATQAQRTSPRGYGGRRIDPHRAAEHLEHRERLSELGRGLARLELDEEAHADACRARKLLLGEAGLASRLPHKLSHIRRCHWCHLPAREYLHDSASLVHAVFLSSPVDAGLA